MTTKRPTKYKDNLGAVFIDASHKYEDGKRDITLWLHKVKIGGILAGHDYGGEFEGVKKAVDECLSDYHIHTDKTNSCWWIYKLK